MKYLMVRLLLVVACSYATAESQPINFDWYQPLDSELVLIEPLSLQGLEEANFQSLKNNRYWLESEVNIEKAGHYYFHFSQTSSIANYAVYFLDPSNNLVKSFKGGIREERTDTEPLIQYAQSINIEKGLYRVVITIDSPVLLIAPQFFISPVADFQRSNYFIDFLIVFCLGILFSMAVYYAVMSIVRKSSEDFSYALFIIFNFIFYAAALGVLNKVFNVVNYGFFLFPLLVSNASYVYFVSRLVSFNRKNNPILWRATNSVLGLFAFFALIAVFSPMQAINLVKIEVIIFSGFTLFISIIRIIQKDQIAKYYIIANATFSTLAISTVFLTNIPGFNYTIELFGLMIVTFEVILLSIVVAQQWRHIERENVALLEDTQIMLRIAHQDSLTKIGNRYAFDQNINRKLPFGLTIIDMDNLKVFNDLFGHERGDEYLIEFSSNLQNILNKNNKLYRIGGDEFAIISFTFSKQTAETKINETIISMKEKGFEQAGASYGTVKSLDFQSVNELMRSADQLMYKHKRTKVSVHSRTLFSVS